VLYLGVRDYGNDYDAIKYHYQVELRNRSSNAHRNKVINDNKRYVKRATFVSRTVSVARRACASHGCRNHVAANRSRLFDMVLHKVFHRRQSQTRRR